MLKKNCQGKIHPHVAQLRVTGRLVLGAGDGSSRAGTRSASRPGSCRERTRGQQLAHGVSLLLVLCRVSLLEGRHGPLALQPPVAILVLRCCLSPEENEMTQIKGDKGFWFNFFSL